jgi:hypothetical protein
MTYEVSPRFTPATEIIDAQQAMAATVLLVGIESPFLRIVSSVLSRGWSVYTAWDTRALQELLETTNPAIVVFEHTQPFDLYELNPRRFGFDGPILLIAEDPRTAQSQLGTEILLRKPSNLSELSRLIAELMEGANG